MTGLFFKAKIGHLLPDFIFYSRSTAWLQAVEKFDSLRRKTPRGFSVNFSCIACAYAHAHKLRGLWAAAI